MHYLERTRPGVIIVDDILVEVGRAVRELQQLHGLGACAERFDLVVLDLDVKVALHLVVELARRQRQVDHHRSLDRFADVHVVAHVDRQAQVAAKLVDLFVGSLLDHRHDAG